MSIVLLVLLNYAEDVNILMTMSSCYFANSLVTTHVSNVYPSCIQVVLMIMSKGSRPFNQVMEMHNILFEATVDYVLH